MASAVARLMLAAVVGASVIAAPAHAAGPPRPGDPRIEQRVDALVAQMTNEEKARLMTHVNPPPGDPAAGFIPGIDRLGIPPLILSDGPAGVRDGQPATALPAPVSLAASFDRSLGRRYGAVIGREAKARGYGVIYAPMVNIVRTPLGGRDFETLGEDPFLTGAIGSAEIVGMQAQHVAAQVKHYAANNQENERMTSSSNVDERTLREIYLPAFEEAVKQAHVWSVMCAYNKVNGVFSCENSVLLRQILINEWGFDGVVGSDYPANHSTVASALAGLDQEFLSTFFQALPQAVADGRVPQAILDDAARRILRMEARIGLLDGHGTGPAPDFDADSRFARDAAEQGSVLLKDRGGALPLDARRLRSLAVIGPRADQAFTGGGGSSHVTPTRTVDPVTGLRQRLGSGVNVTFTKAGTTSAVPAIPASVLSGLQGEYFAGDTFDGTPALTRADPNVDFDFGAGSPAPGLPTDHFSIRWTGTLTPAVSGSYRLATTSDDGSQLFLDGQLVVDNSGDHAAQTRLSDPIDLVAGHAYSIRLEYHEDGGDASVSLGWVAPAGAAEQFTDAVNAARGANAAVVVVDSDSSEGSDRTTLALPGDQDALIAAVAAANPRTIVVLRAGAPVLMPWLSQVPAVLDTWYPGQEDGGALAALLTGDAEPSGRLPVSFPRTDTQTPANAPPRYPAVDGNYDYTEGLQVGYRWYDAQNEDPLFPFGFGLSYTRFRYDHLRIGGGSGGATTVSLDVTNTGGRDGSDVVQLYLGYPRGSGEPPKALKGFHKVRIAHGHTRRVTFALTRDDLAVWDATAHARTVLDGTYPIMVGASSRDVRLRGAITVRQTVGAQFVAVDAPAVTTPGHAQTVKTTFTNTGDFALRDVDLGLRVPDGWTAAPIGAGATHLLGLDAHGSASVSWTVTAPASARAGADTITGTAAYRLAGRRLTRTATATMTTPFATLAAAFDNRGISSNADPGAANLDGGGYSFSAEALAAVGYTPGATVTAAGHSYTWPDTTPGQLDNATGSGQLISVGRSGSSLSFLGTGTFGTQQATAHVTYTDGTTADVALTFPDWFSNAATGNAQLAVTTANWNRPPTDTIGPHAVSLYATGGALDPAKTVSTVALPSNGSVHIFAMAVDP
jgi:beta-glucosidase